MANPFIPRPTAYDHPDLEADRALLRTLSPLAWKYAQQYAAGSPPPGEDATDTELQGWRAYRRGYSRPPLWLKHESGEQKMRRTS